MPDPSNIAENIREIQQKIATYAIKYQRDPNDIRLLAVSKTKSADFIHQAYQAGLRDFGESYLQEALEKIASLNQYAINWHFIGHIQSNKTRDIANAFDWVHSVDRLKIARRLSEQRQPTRDKLNICIQVNLGNEASKSGVAADQALQLAKDIQGLPGLRLRGLMAIPAKADSLQQQRTIFSEISHLYDQIKQQGLELDTLSMGMSNDLEAAIAEGSSIVRIGTAIFGQRPTKN